MFGNPETTTGGNALKFYASVRLDIRRIGSIKKGDEVIGSETRVKVVKNKVAPPFKQADFDILYGDGISREGEMVDLGVLHKVVEKPVRGQLRSRSHRTGQRQRARVLKEHPSSAAEIEAKIRAAGVTEDAPALAEEHQDATPGLSAQPTRGRQPATAHGRDWPASLRPACGFARREHSRQGCASSASGPGRAAALLTNHGRGWPRAASPTVACTPRSRFGSSRCSSFQKGVSQDVMVQTRERVRRVSWITRARCGSSALAPASLREAGRVRRAPRAARLRAGRDPQSGGGDGEA